jgi:hypothetical protein
MSSDKEGLKNKCAIVIPIHPKHYDNYGKSIVEQLSNEDCDADLYFVFSNQQDKNNFKHGNSKTKSIVLTDYLSGELMGMVRKKKSWVSVKKLIGLRELYLNYEYITCIDSEVLFLKKNNFYEMMKNVDEKRKILVSEINAKKRETLKNIIKGSSITQDVGCVEKIKKMTNNYNYYSWWNNVPVYSCGDLGNYFNFIGLNRIRNFIKRINWFFFENISYNYYCVLNRNFEIVVDKRIDNSIESTNSTIIEDIDKNVLKLSWVPNKAFKQNNDYYKNNDFYIVYHLDIDRR